MPVMTCQLCRGANKYCEPRVCSNCRGQYYRCYDCNDADCPCGGGRWLLLSEARDRRITPRAPQVLGTPPRGASLKPSSSSSSSSKKPKREPRDEMKLKRTHSRAELKSNSAKRIAEDEEEDRDEDGGDDGEQGGDAIVIEAPRTTQASSTQGALVIMPQAVSAQTVIGATTKMPLSAFLAQVKLLTDGILHICPEGGMTRDQWEARYRELEAHRRKLLAMLSGPSCISGVKNRGGIAHLIEDLDPQLLHASDVLRKVRAELDRLDREGPLQIGPLQPTQKCILRARAGEVLIRYWKIYRSYAAIWGGARWNTAGLQTLIGDSGHPVQLLSKRNVERLMDQLRRERVSRLEPGTITGLQERRILADERADEIDHEIAALRQQLADMDADLDEEPDPNRVEEIQDEIADLLEEREELELDAARIQRTLRRLTHGMGLEEDEHELFIELVKLPFKLKHATNAWYCIANDGRLDSYTEIKRKHPDWQSEFSTNGNIEALGNGGFVFFRLDVGCGEITTRYGESLVTCDIDLLARHGWVSMYDQLKPLSSKTMQCMYDASSQLIRKVQMCGIGDTKLKYSYGCRPRQKVRVKTKNPDAPPKYRIADASEFEEVWFEREVSFLDLVFHGPQIHQGIALAVILELRFLRRCGYRGQVLAKMMRCSADGGSPDGSTLSPRQAYLGKVLSRLFRPEAKYPVALRLSHTPPQVSKPEGDSRYRPDGTENPAVMPGIRLEQRRKEIEARLHVTRQQGGGARSRTEKARKSYLAEVKAGGENSAKAKRFKATAQRNTESAATWDTETRALETELAEVKRQLNRQ